MKKPIAFSVDFFKKKKKGQFSFFSMLPFVEKGTDYGFLYNTNKMEILMGTIKHDQIPTKYFKIHFLFNLEEYLVLF